jgi:hypothetical protein
LAHLHEYCDQLYFEIGGMPGEADHELIITAAGNPDFFGKVESIINNAPVIDNWTFIAFIQPKDNMVTANFEGIELKPAEMWFLPLNSASRPKSIGIRVCTPNYGLVRDSEWFESAVYQVLDTILGEKSFALDIDHIDFGELPAEPPNHGMIELIELPAYVKWKKANEN